MGHTPGPWWIEEPDDDAEDDRQISDCFGNTATVYGDPETATANARLIAAAPELLSLVKRLREVFEELDDGWRVMDATRVDELIASDGLHACVQAIAKAEGTDEQAGAMD